MSELIKPQNNLLTDYKRSEIKKSIVERLKTMFSNVQQYKYDNEFLLLTCSLIEYFVKKKYNIDKKCLLIEIYNEVFLGTLTTEDMEQIKNNIQFLFNNNKIKKLSYYRLFLTSCKEWVKKKFYNSK